MITRVQNLIMVRCPEVGMVPHWDRRLTATTSQQEQVSELLLTFRIGTKQCLPVLPDKAVIPVVLTMATCSRSGLMIFFSQFIFLASGLRAPCVNALC